MREPVVEFVVKGFADRLLSKMFIAKIEYPFFNIDDCFKSATKTIYREIKEEVAKRSISNWSTKRKRQTA